jgi:predicted DNA-binding protein (MmcQ/YjbR family)
MDRDSVRAWCASRPGATEEFPFGDDVAVFKVGGKIFAILTVDSRSGSVSLKCDPRWAEHLRQVYPAVSPGYHLSKRHWNTVLLDGTVADGEIAEMLGHSYTIVAEFLPRSRRPLFDRDSRS